MKLIITIDTEEDNWKNYSRDNNPCENIEQLPSLQGMFDDFNARPTYLVTYPVVRNEKAVSILNRFLLENKCEIGAHCHPWNTPPFEEEISDQNSMLFNLPKDLVFKKISCLHDAIIQTLGMRPTSFRSGRFAFNANVAEALIRLGYKIDTSMTPFMNWSESQGSDFSRVFPNPYKFSSDDIFKPLQDGSLLEIPVTIGFLQNNFKIANFFHRFLSAKPIGKFHAIGILAKLQWLNRISLSPELSDEKEMIAIAKVFLKKNFQSINMYFHSTSLKAGCSDFVKTKEDEKAFMGRIRNFLEFARDSGIESIRLSDTMSLV